MYVDIITVLAQATSQWLDRTRTESLGSLLFWCPGLSSCFTLGVFCVMDDAWLRRLSVRPEGSAFVDYARALRLLSGMNHVGFLRALARARQRKIGDEEERNLRSNPAVVEFVRFLESVPRDDLPVVISVVSEGLFPNGTPGWFTSDCPDPCSSPSAALAHVGSLADEVIANLSPLVDEPEKQPDHAWVQEPVTNARWADDLVRTTFSEDVLDAVRSGVPDNEIVLPSQCLFKIKVEIVADGQRIAFEKFTLHKKTKALNLVKVIKSSFSGMLEKLRGVLFENFNKAEIAPEVVLYDALPEVTKFEYRVDWNELVNLHGLEVLSKAFDLPESLASNPKDVESTSEIRLDLKADTMHLVSKKLLVPAKAKIGDIAEAVVSGFDGFFDDVPFEMKLDENGDALDLDAFVSDIRPSPDWLVFGVSLESLTSRYGEEKIRRIFPTATNVSTEVPLKTGISPGLLEVCIQADSYVISRRQVHVPCNGTAEELIQCVTSTFGPVLTAVRGYLSTSEGQPVARDTDLASVFPGVQSYTYHVSFEELLRSAGPDDIGLAFPDAECLKDMDRFPELKRLFDLYPGQSGTSVPSVPVSTVADTGHFSSVGVTVRTDSTTQQDEADLGAGAPTSKAVPAQSPFDGEDKEGFRILQIKLFMEKQLLMLRYEKISKSMTAKDLKDRLWELVPSQYQFLDCEVFVGGTHVQLSLGDCLSENLRPSEVSLDFQMLVDRLSGEELSKARAVCLSALALHDAAVVAPKSPVEGPGKPRHTRRKDRSATPVRGRPVFGGEPSSRVPSSLSVPAKRARRAAMEPRDDKKDAASPTTGGGFVLHYSTMPALSQEQNSYLASLAERVSQYLKETKVVRMATIYERGLEDPLMYTTPFLDQSLRSMSARWKLPLLTFGEKWTITLQADPTALPPRLVEIKGDDATLFMQVKDLRDEDRVPESRSRRRSRSHGDRNQGDRGSRRRRRDSSRHDDRGHPGSEDRGKSHGPLSNEGGKRHADGVMGRCLDTAVDSPSGPAETTQLWCVGSDGHLCRQSPFEVPEVIPVDTVPSPLEAEEVEQISKPDVDRSQAQCAGLKVEQCEYPEGASCLGVSPTATWSQPVGATSQSSPQLMTEHLEAVLSDIMLKPVPYNGGCGRWLKAYPLIVQTENLQLGSAVGSGDQLAYMVRVGSPDFCHSCFSLFQAEHSPTTCPRCGVPTVPPVLKFVDTEGSSAPELQVLRRYVPRPQDVFETPWEMYS